MRVHVGRRVFSAAILVGLVVGPATGSLAEVAPRPDNSGAVSVADLGFEPDPILGANPQPPSRDVARVKRDQRRLTAAAPAFPDYVRDGYIPQPLAYAQLAYHDAKAAPVVDDGLHDAVGVRMFRWQGVTYNHPVAQAQWGLRNLNTYRTTKNSFFLDRAIAQARRNLERRVESRGAWWYPYDFDLPRCAGQPLMQAPWYSAMAQGQLLSLFVRLFETTGDAQWRTAADSTFTSLTLPPAAGAPWASWVDTAGQLWLEEYPRTSGITGERVLNGHTFAGYGVYDYWRLTGDPRAVAIFDGAASTVRRYIIDGFRTPNWAERYSLARPGTHVGYHQIHTAQALMLHRLTHASTFARDAFVLRADYPAPGVIGTIRFSAGTHVGYSFDTTGKITGQKTVTLSRASGAPADKRIRVLGRGIYYHITAGIFAGRYVAETPNARILLGRAVEHAYTPQLSLAFQPGAYVAYRYDNAGNVTATKKTSFYRASSAPTSASAWTNGRLSYLMSAGVFAGYWLVHTPGLALR